jgi:hypothetical protein
VIAAFRFKRALRHRDPMALTVLQMRTFVTPLCAQTQRSHHAMAISLARTVLQNLKIALLPNILVLQERAFQLEMQVHDAARIMCAEPITNMSNNTLKVILLIFLFAIISLGYSQLSARQALSLLSGGACLCGNGTQACQSQTGDNLKSCKYDADCAAINCSLSTQGLCNGLTPGACSTSTINCPSVKYTCQAGLFGGPPEVCIAAGDAGDACGKYTVCNN